MTEDIEDMELLKREDIEYSKILMWQLNDIRQLQTYIYDRGTFRTNVKNFMNAVNALRSLLIPYLDIDIKRMETSKIDASASKQNVEKYYETCQDILEQLMKQMHIKNLLLERFSSIEM